MAKDQGRTGTFGRLLNQALESIEEIFSNDPFVILSELEKSRTSATTAFIKGQIYCCDGSLLSIFQHFRFDGGHISLTDYRYHFMNGMDQLIFRYDNAPHHGEVSTHPHHKHTPSGVQPAECPSLKELLAEMDAIIAANLIEE